MHRLEIAKNVVMFFMTAFATNIWMVGRQTRNGDMTRFIAYSSVRNVANLGLR